MSGTGRRIRATCLTSQDSSHAYTARVHWGPYRSARVHMGDYRKRVEMGVLTIRLLGLQGFYATLV